MVFQQVKGYFMQRALRIAMYTDASQLILMVCHSIYGNFMP